MNNAALAPKFSTSLTGTLWWVGKQIWKLDWGFGIKKEGLMVVKAVNNCMAVSVRCFKLDYDGFLSRFFPF